MELLNIAAFGVIGIAVCAAVLHGIAALIQWIKGVH